MKRWLRFVYWLEQIDHWLEAHARWFHCSPVWMPVCQWIHAELSVWEKPGRKAMRKSCNICLWGASRNAQPGDALDCTIGGDFWPRTRGDAIPATVVECPSSYHSLKARLEGLRIDANHRVSRDLCESAEVEFFINTSGQACTCLWWA